ncbi:MAG: hypothetical protein FWC03_11040 [Treponema sp.]|nr:hypothetical protein [Treponema sp.]
MENKNNIGKYLWQMAYSHAIAYCLAGFIGLFVYQELYDREIVSSYLRSADDPVVALGPILQLLRGLIIGLVILPVRKVFFEEKNGLLKLGLIFIGLSLLSTIGPVISSFEGFIFMTMPLKYHFWGYPEAIIYVFLFIGILKLSIKFEHNKITTLLPVMIIIMIGLISILGFMAGKGYF